MYYVIEIEFMTIPTILCENIGPERFNHKMVDGYDKNKDRYTIA